MCHDEKKQSIIGVLEREEMEKGLESLFKEIPTENFPNLGRVLGIQVIKLIGCPKILIQNHLTPGTLQFF